MGSPTTQPSQPPPNFSEKGPPRPTVGSGPPPRGQPWTADFRERHGGCWSFKDGRGQHGEGDKGAGGIRGSTASRQASPKSLLGRGSALATSPSAGVDHTPWRPTQAHLWVRTTWHSRACGRRASRHARQRAGHEGGGRAWAPRPPPPCPGEGLTSAWPPGVSVLLQCSHLRQNLCQSLPRELTFSAGAGGGSGPAPSCPPALSCLLPPLSCPLLGSLCAGSPSSPPRSHVAPACSPTVTTFCSPGALLSLWVSGTLITLGHGLQQRTWTGSQLKHLLIPSPGHLPLPHTHPQTLQSGPNGAGRAPPLKGGPKPPEPLREASPCRHHGTPVGQDACLSIFGFLSLSSERPPPPPRLWLLLWHSRSETSC